jgi:hypothetical protein
VLLLCCLGRDFCFELVALSDVSYRVCLFLTMCDIGTSTKVTLAVSLAAAPQKESNIKFTYRHSNCSRRLLPALRQCGCFSRVSPFIGHISEKVLGVEGKHVFRGIPDRRDNTLCFSLQI